VTDRDTVNTITSNALDQLYAERDGAYRERAQLLALLAALHPSVIAPAPDIDEDGWQILYLRIGGKQASWHITPRDAELYAHVEHVPADDRRAQWDGHTTEQKYAHIGQHAARLYAEARGRVEQYRFATTWTEYNAGRNALNQPAPGPAAAQAVEHRYLSTGCLHGKHDYCSNVDGIAGLKKPAQCKFCAAPCQCSCHTVPGPAAAQAVDNPKEN
jgi:hypothetical protein